MSQYVIIWARPTSHLPGERASSQGRPSPRSARPPPQEAETMAPILGGGQGGAAWPGGRAGAEGLLPLHAKGQSTPYTLSWGTWGGSRRQRQRARRRPGERRRPRNLCAGAHSMGKVSPPAAPPGTLQGPQVPDRGTQLRSSRGMTAGSESILSSGRPPASSSNCRGYRWWRACVQKLPGHSPRPPSSSVEVVSTTRPAQAW